jgi:hypothetical protein
MVPEGVELLAITTKVTNCKQVKGMAENLSFHYLRASAFSIR